MIGQCKLCSNTRTLRASHIFPKFIFRWMKETGGSYFRQLTNPNIRQQDGQKEYWLCHDCEQRFSVAETYFAKEIFYPYLNAGQVTFNYDERLIYFLISLLWRILIGDLDDYKAEK